MLIMLFGITGAGKSYFTKMIVDKLPFNKVVAVTNREKRIEEVEGIDKYFVSDEELHNKINSGEIGFYFNYLGVTYAYLKEDLDSDDNNVLEMHYTEFEKLKKMYPNMIAIYIMPTNIEVAKEALKMRNLPFEKEQARMIEMAEEYMLFNENRELLRAYDSVFYNNYDEESDKKMLELIENYIEIKEDFTV